MDKLPDSMFDVFKIDPEPVSLHFDDYNLMLTIQRKYNKQQCEYLIRFIQKHTSNLKSVGFPDSWNDRGTATAICLKITFSAAANVEPARLRINE